VDRPVGAGKAGDELILGRFIATISLQKLLTGG